jgi:hypothetical protein
VVKIYLADKGNKKCAYNLHFRVPLETQKLDFIPKIMETEKILAGEAGIDNPGPQD